MSTLGWVTAGLLAVYIVGIVGALLKPPRQPDPQRGVAVGCLMMAAAAIGVLLVVTVIADLYQVRWLVWTGFIGAIFPAISLAGAGVRWLILKVMGKEP